MCQTNLKQSKKLLESGVTGYLLKQGIKPIGWWFKSEFDETYYPYKNGFEWHYNKKDGVVYGAFSTNDLWKAMPKTILTKTDTILTLLYDGEIEQFQYEDEDTYVVFAIFDATDFTQCLVNMWTYLMKENLLKGDYGE